MQTFQQNIDESRNVNDFLIATEKLYFPIAPKIFKLRVTVENTALTNLKLRVTVDNTALTNLK